MDHRVTAVAVDGGQSALRLRVLPDGGTGTGPGYLHGRDGVRATVDGVRQAARQAGLDGCTVDVAALGLTGYPADPEKRRLLATAIADVLRATEVRLCGDMVTSHAGALPDGYGVVVAAGTGVVCLAIDRDGSWHQVDGHGYLFGDHGSAFAVGRAGIAAVQRARDGRGRPTSMTRTAPRPGDLYSSAHLVNEVAQFAPTVLRCAADGDEVAQGILRQAVEDLAETISTGVRLLTGRGPVPVACVGGLFAAGDQLLGPISTRLPDRAVPAPAAGSSLDGAARLALRPLEPYAAVVTTYRFP